MTPAPILVVDDDDATRSMLLALLRANGYEASGVATGAAALEELARTPFELALLDLQLPGDYPRRPCGSSCAHRL